MLGSQMIGSSLQLRSITAFQHDCLIGRSTHSLQRISQWSSQDDDGAVIYVFQRYDLPNAEESQDPFSLSEDVIYLPRQMSHRVHGSTGIIHGSEES